MIEPNIYCKVSGMALQCISDFNKENGRHPLVVEIGCADGQGTMRFAGFAARVICIDPMVNGRPDIDGNIRENLPVDIDKIRLFRHRTMDFDLSLVVGCSIWPETVAEVNRLLQGAKIDVLIIDGCHHPFEAVYADFETYYPMVTCGGYVIFDDLYEECIQQAYDKARDDHKMIEHDRFAIKRSDCLQDTASLKKTES